MIKAAVLDIWRFLKGHWVHMLIGVPAVVGFTVLHELAHCIAVWMQGGTVTEFVWLPSGDRWGYMAYDWPPGAVFSTEVVALFPYLCWTASALVAAIVAARERPWPFWWASTVFVWLYIVPLADVANAAMPWALRDADNDLRSAFGPTSPTVMTIVIAFALACCVSGFALQRQLYRERAMRWPAFVVLAVLGFAVLGAFTL